MHVVPHPSAATLTARWEVTPPTWRHSNVLRLPSPPALTLILPPTLPEQEASTRLSQVREQTTCPAQGCPRGKWDKPSRKSWLASYNVMQIRKRPGPGQTRLGETLHDQGCIIRLYIQPTHTSWGGKGYAHTYMHTGRRYLLLSLAFAGSACYKGESHAVHSRSLTWQDPK